MFDLHVGFLRISCSCFAELENLLTLVSTFVLAYGCSSSFKELLRLPGISYSIYMHTYIRGISSVIPKKLEYNIETLTYHLCWQTVETLLRPKGL